MRRFMSLFAILCIMMMAGGTMAQGETTVIGGTEDQMRDLITRILGGYSPEMATEIFIASVPEDLAQWAPIPEDATLIASVRRSGPNLYGPGIGTEDSMMLEVFINGGDPESNYNYFLDQLTAQGMTVIDSTLNNMGGFTPNVSGYGNLCDEEQGISVNFDTSKNPGGVVYSTLRVQSPADIYQCSQGRPSEPPYVDPMTDIIPALNVPEGVTVTTNRNGTIYYNAQMIGLSAEITTSLSMAEVKEAYTDQLEAAGWENTLDESSSATSLTHWHITAPDDSEWLGVFSLEASPAGDGAYLANILVMSADRD
ncbi:hypothetical protein G4Y79_08750 [Phototrophicus methaneseepsis]|uniref:Uncharacterized protein n=1 Tax=Phototrophicus methaneseepsis TaxID=2710758 RepID=A0A7S8IG98_9CHLR|nr:hypothetical protein [Phototrophicus methaneseepsis]QPC84447.1 hypothetical protein G4Y79_08750 [Phototrophicus methaneseepsis]